MALLYKDGKTEPKKGDTVLGPKLKGQISSVLKSTVTVATLAPYDPKNPTARKTIQVERDPATLEMVHRD